MGSIFTKMFTGTHAKLYTMTGGRGLGGGVTKDGAVLLLHHVGRKSGKSHTTPLQYVIDGESLMVVASAGGSDRDPGWLHNLRAQPNVEVTVGADRRPVHARVTEGAERDDRWRRFIATDSRFGRYQTKTDRIIPVVVLEPRDAGGGSSW